MNLKRTVSLPVLCLLLLSMGACGQSLPEDITDYRSRCVQMNAAAIPPYDGDPHRGTKDVFACNVEEAALRANQRPFADGTIIVKESTRVGEDFPWLVAVARKNGGEWTWAEYTRNFENEDLSKLLVPQSTCTDCHKAVAAADWIYTAYTPR